MFSGVRLTPSFQKFCMKNTANNTVWSSLNWTSNLINNETCKCVLLFDTKSGKQV